MKLHEGDRFATGGMMLVKQCACRGTSSGPRLANDSRLRIVDCRRVTDFKLTMAGMVCDVCGTPWKEESDDGR